MKRGVVITGYVLAGAILTMPFVLRSPSDRLSDLQVKMAEYIENGCRLGWLLDPIEKRAFIYRSGFSIQQIDNPTILNGDPELPGFEFDFREIL